MGELCSWIKIIGVPESEVWNTVLYSVRDMCISHTLLWQAIGNMGRNGAQAGGYSERVPKVTCNQFEVICEDRTGTHSASGWTLGIPFSGDTIHVPNERSKMVLFHGHPDDVVFGIGCSGLDSYHRLKHHRRWAEARSITRISKDFNLFYF